MCVVHVISVGMFVCRHECSIKHFQISQVAQPLGKVYILDQQFQTLEDLVNFYSQRDVPNVEAIAGVRLTCPIVYSADDTASLHDGTLRRRLPRRVSAGDAAHSQNNRELSRAGGSSGAVLTYHHSVSDSQSDRLLLSKDRNWCSKILRTLMPSNRKNGADAQNGMVQSLSSHTSGEVNSNLSCSSLAESPKKFGKQPAIPDGNTDPPFPSMHENLSATLIASGADAGLYYSEPRDVDRELSTDFIAHLLQHDTEDHTDDGKCVCGLDLADSELPRGWSMHKSTERGTEGRLFFTSPTGETSWELPTIVSVDLDAQQQDRIGQLMIEGQTAVHGNSSQPLSLSHRFSDSDKRISV